jgi:D-aminoacyl-tRNA deacylase
VDCVKLVFLVKVEQEGPMRAVIQRARSARVTVQGRVVGEIGRGLLVLLGVAKGDTETHAAELAEKIVGLRVFADADDKMNLGLTDVQGGLLVVSQFTLFADVRRGRRPFFGGAEAPEQARALCGCFCAKAQALGVTVAQGEFGALMQVQLTNDGPVTLVIDSADLAAPRRASSRGVDP